MAKVEEAEVTEALENLAKNAQNFEDRDEGAAAESGDQVVFNFSGSVDGELFDGGAAEDYPLVLGSNSFIPGFEDQLIGARLATAWTSTSTFPEDYQAENLKGKDAVFACEIKAVKAPAEAAIDDELAKKFGSEDLAALKTQIEERLSAEYAGAARQVMKRGLLDALDEAVKFELPPSLVEAEAKQIAHQLFHEENEDVDPNDHSHGDIEPSEEHNSLAERRVRLGLLLAEIGQKNEIQVSDAEMTQAVMNQARQYPGQERQFFEFVQQNAQMRQQLQAPIFEDKVVDYLFELAEVSKKRSPKMICKKLSRPWKKTTNSSPPI